MFYGYDPSKYRPNLNFINNAVSSIGDAVSMIPEIKEFDRNRKMNDQFSGQLYEDVQGFTQRASQDENILNAYGKNFGLVDGEGRITEKGQQTAVEMGLVESGGENFQALEQDPKGVLSQMFMKSAEGSYLQPPEMGEDGKHATGHVDKYVNGMTEKMGLFWNQFTGDGKDIDHPTLNSFAVASNVRGGSYAFNKQQVDESRNRQAIDNVATAVSTPGEAESVRAGGLFFDVEKGADFGQAVRDQNVHGMIDSPSLKEINSTSTNDKTSKAQTQSFQGGQSLVKSFHAYRKPIKAVGEAGGSTFVELNSSDEQAIMTRTGEMYESLADAYNVKSDPSFRGQLINAVQADIKIYNDSVQAWSKLRGGGSKDIDAELDTITKIQKIVLAEETRAKEDYDRAFSQYLTRTGKEPKDGKPVDKKVITEFENTLGKNYKDAIDSTKQKRNEIDTWIAAAGADAAYYWSRTEQLEVGVSEDLVKVAQNAREAGDAAGSGKKGAEATQAMLNAQPYTQEQVAGGEAIVPDQGMTAGRAKQAKEQAIRAHYSRYADARKNAPGDALPIEEWMKSKEFQQLEANDPALRGGALQVEPDPQSALDEQQDASENDMVRTGWNAFVDAIGNADSTEVDAFFNSPFGKEFKGSDRKMLESALIGGNLDDLDNKIRSKVGQQWSLHQNDKKGTGAPDAEQIVSKQTKRRLAVVDTLQGKTWADNLANSKKMVSSGKPALANAGSEVFNTLNSVPEELRELPNYELYAGANVDGLKKILYFKMRHDVKDGVALHKAISEDLKKSAPVVYDQMAPIDPKHWTRDRLKAIMGEEAYSAIKGKR